MQEPKYDLPTAIRIGAQRRPQTQSGQTFKDGATCAMGAAMDAEAGRPSSSDGFELWPELRFKIDDSCTLWGAICQLNDEARWTREEIADWLDVILP